MTNETTNSGPDLGGIKLYIELARNNSGVEYEIHRHGCGDIEKKGLRSGGSKLVATGTNFATLAEYIDNEIAELEDEGLGTFSHIDWRIMPCATKEERR